MRKERENRKRTNIVAAKRNGTGKKTEVNRSVTNVSYICLLKSLAAKRSLRPFSAQHTFARIGLFVSISADNPEFLFMAKPYQYTRSSVDQKSHDLNLALQIFTWKFKCKHTHLGNHLHAKRLRLRYNTHRQKKNKRNQTQIHMSSVSFRSKWNERRRRRRRRQKRATSVRSHPPTEIFFDYPISCQSSTIRCHNTPHSAPLTVLLFVSRFAAHRSRMGFSLRQWTQNAVRCRLPNQKRNEDSIRNRMLNASAHVFEYNFPKFLFYTLLLLYISFVLLSLRVHTVQLYMSIGLAGRPV